MVSPLDAIRKNPITLLVIPQERHVATLNGVAGTLQRDFGGTCIVSYLRPASTILAQFASAHMATEGFFFIDTLTASVHQPGNAPNTIFIRSPADLTELSLAISEVLKTGVFKNLLFDGVDAMLVYQDREPVVQFIHNTITKCTIQGVRVVFTITKGAVHSEIIKDLHMFVDTVVSLEEPAGVRVETA